MPHYYKKKEQRFNMEELMKEWDNLPDRLPRGSFKMKQYTDMLSEDAVLIFPNGRRFECDAHECFIEVKNG